MPPFEWSDIARNNEMNAGFDGVARRFEQVDRRFERLDVRLDSFASDFHTMSRAIVLSVMAMAVTLAVLVVTVGVNALATP